MLAYDKLCEFENGVERIGHQYVLDWKMPTGGTERNQSRAVHGLVLKSGIVLLLQHFLE
jgi:hypothetical protein